MPPAENARTMVEAREGKFAMAGGASTRLGEVTAPRLSAHGGTVAVADGAPDKAGRSSAMKLVTATLFSLCVFAGPSSGQAAMRGESSMPKPEDIRAVAPALEGYAEKFVRNDLWKRPGLSHRDRSIVTLAALIARDQTVELPYYMALALDSGVKPSEISEIITHLAFYTGWANAVHAIPTAREVFKSRNIGLDQLPPASRPQLPLD